jgi:hypothetical protein
LNYENQASRVFNIPARTGAAGGKFFEGFFSGAKDLGSRFHWCVALTWPTVDGTDIEAFLRMKKIRNDLAHGEHVDEKDLPVDQARGLALKLLRQSPQVEGAG